MPSSQSSGASSSSNSKGGGSDRTSSSKGKGTGKYMHTADHGNDQRRPEDGPTDLKAKYRAWPGMENK
jgi:hypothetical protein